MAGDLEAGPGERRLRSGEPLAEDDRARLADELDALRALAAERWRAIGQLAPAAKALRLRAQAAERVLAEVAAVLARDDLAPAARVDDARALLAPRLATTRDNDG
jgi:hypothetical protein